MITVANILALAALAMIIIGCAIAFWLLLAAIVLDTLHDRWERRDRIHLGNGYSPHADGDLFAEWPVPPPEWEEAPDE